jgi:hypothetical protein
LRAGQPRLGFSRLHAAQAGGSQRHTDGVGKNPSERRGLVELAFGFLQRMQWHRNDHIPMFQEQDRGRGADEQFGQKRLEPHLAAVLISVDDVQKHALGHNRRTGIRKRIFLLAAVGAFEWRADIALEGQPAAFAKWRSNKCNIFPAIVAYISVTRGRRFLITDLTNFRVKKAQGGIKPSL